MLLKKVIKTLKTTIPYYKNNEKTQIIHRHDPPHKHYKTAYFQRQDFNYSSKVNLVLITSVTDTGPILKENKITIISITFYFRTETLYLKCF